MKKLSVLLAAATMCMSMPVLAGTGISEEPIAEYGSVSWVENSSLIVVEGDTGYGMADLDGNVLTGMIYDYDMTMEYGYITGYVYDNGVNCMGAFAEDGSVVIPFQYGDVDVLSADWAVAVSLVDATAEQYDYSSWVGDNYWSIDSVDVYYLPEAKLMTTLSRAEFADAEAVGHRINIESRTDGTVNCYDTEFNLLGTVGYVWSEDYADYDYVTFRDNGQTGLMDAEGNVVMEPAFQSLYTRYGNYYEAYTGSKYGVVDLQGNVVVPAEYEDIDASYYMPYDYEYDTRGFNAGGYFCVVKDGKMGYVDETGTVTCEPTYSKSVMSNYGASAILTDLEGTIHIISADGVDTVLEGYERVYPLEYGAGFYYQVTDAEYNYGVIDWHGNVVLPCMYNDVELSGDGRYVMVQESWSSPYQIYELSYPDVSERPEVPAEDGAEPAGDTGEAVTAAEGSDTSEIADVINSALSLIRVDAAANKDAAVTMLESAVTALEDSNAAVASLIQSVITLLETDAAANSGSIITILTQALGML